MDVAINDMTGADVPRIGEIEKVSFTHRWSLSAFRSEMLNPDSICKTARLGGDGTAAGFICVRMMVDEAHILKLAVHPTFRRRRIGSVLVRFIIDEVFLVRGFDGKVIIEARVSNSPAIKLYESLGFKALYMRRRYYTEPEEDAVVMAFDSIKNTRT